MKKISVILILLLTGFNQGFSQGSLNTLTFDGVNDLVAGSNTGLNLITNNFTIEMWVNPTATLTIRTETNAIGNTQGTGGQRYAVFPSHGGGVCPAASGAAGVGISVGTNGIQVFEHRACQMPALLVYNAALPAGWNHIAVVVTAKQPSLYLNGILVRTGVTSNMTSLFPSAQLGTTIYGNYSGSIDEFRVWSTNISQTQIRDNMCKRLIGNEANLVRYFRFDEGAGTTLTDASPSAVNGTLTNGPVWATSAAAIGNTSVYNYTTTWAGVRIVHSSPEGDSLSVNDVSSATINAIHIYHVATVPNITTGITGLGGNDHYFGVFKSFTAGGGGTYTATYYYRENDAFQGSSSVADPDYDENNLRVFTRSNNSSTPWVMNATAPDITGKTFTLTAQSTEFILAYANATANLPIELTTFDAYYADQKVVLNWETSSEVNNDFFTIERSADGHHFEPIRIVDGAGNSNSLLSYTETDFNPLNGTSYYRLKQTDLNGSFTYSNIQTIKTYDQLSEEMSLYPNPTDGAFHVLLNGFGDEEILVVIRDLAGKEFFSKVVITSTDEHLEAIDLSNKLAPGNYVVTASSKNELYTQLITIK